MGMHLKIFELLPKTDCQKCGHDTCPVFAAELAQKQTCIEACPNISDDAERVLRKSISAERTSDGDIALGHDFRHKEKRCKKCLALDHQHYKIQKEIRCSYLLFTLFRSPRMVYGIWNETTLLAYVALMNN
jgi:Na+-translocating ferredoxin:NAD+ oxidoreductase RNF subunit RnfB